MALYFHSPSVSNDSESTAETDATTKSKELKNISYSQLCPFDSFGINTNVPLINLTTQNRTLIAYACSHMIILYNYETRETFPLQGHKNSVKTMSLSQNGKWLLSADFEKDCAVVVWDTETGLPICTLFNPHGGDELTSAGISPNAKYVVTVGNAKSPVINFWLWTNGKNEPDDSVQLTESVLDPVKEVAFDGERCERFVLTTDRQVVFFTWENGKLRYNYSKMIESIRGPGSFNCSCHVTKARQILTATTNGFVIVWEDDQDECMDNDEANKNGEKRHLKFVQLQKCNITVLLYNGGMVITGNSEGRINFYDHQLRILYWCRNPSFDIIRSISFDLQTGLLAPEINADESELEFGDEFEEEGEYGETRNYERFHPTAIRYKEASKLTVKLEPTLRRSNKPKNSEIMKEPRDASLEGRPISIGNFFICTAAGVVALIQVSKLLCHFIFQSIGGSITSLDIHPQSNYLAIGTSRGTLFLYNYQDRIRITSRTIPALPDFNPILQSQAANNEIVYVTCPECNENSTAVSILKYSPRCDLLVCGTENGALWMLHPVTFELIDNTPYKHSREPISKLTFTKCAEYMAYSDNSLTVGVFKRTTTGKENLWSFLGKYRSHCLTIVDVIFAPPAANTKTPRFLSLGKDKDLIEYDLENSGPYPDPGLKILQIDRVEYSAIPLSLISYPRLGFETFLLISNSEYKYRLLNDITKTIRGTFLCPTFDSPVCQIKILPETEINHGYMIFATRKEIGLQILPLDGNPHKALGMIGHPQKIKDLAISHDGRVLFTFGENDPCVLIWKIKTRSVDVLARLGGDGLSPFYCLIEGGKNGWLINEMRDLFYYAQILHQGEDTVATRVVSDKVSTKQIPNLMRAIGFYPSNEELEIIMGEISYRYYAETGQLLEEITFEDFVKLYTNHRPVSGITTSELRKAWKAFVPFDKIHENKENLTLTREQFMNILFGRGPERFPEKGNELFGEPFTYQEAQLCLRPLDKDSNGAHRQEKEARFPLTDFSFLPEGISYKDFITDIMGIELPEESRADDA